MDCHIIFDVKMEDFRRKDRLVAGGRVTDPPATIIYVSVVSRQTVRISFALADLNDFPLKVVSIQNYYITAPVTKKIWTVLGPEFGEDSGRKSIVVRSLYGLNSSGTVFWINLSDCMPIIKMKDCLRSPLYSR